MTACIDHDEWLTVPQAIEYSKISRTKLYSYMKDGSLPFFYLKDTDHRRIRKSDLDKLMVPGSPQEVDETDE